MAKDLVIVDSCVFIRAFRNDASANNALRQIEGRTVYSVITQLELLVGATTAARKEALLKIFNSYYGIPLSPEISKEAVKLMQKYIAGQQTMSVPDCLIAATAIVSGLPLLTYNQKDFDFIEEIKLYK